MAGALQYQEYDFVTRLVMRLIASRHGTYAGTGGDHDFTDTKHDHEFTDWEALDRFASAFASTLIQQPSPN